MHIQTNDIVVVRKGNDKPSSTDAKDQRASDASIVRVTMPNGTVKEYKAGKVLKLYTKENRVLVEGVNKVLKHMKKSRQNPRGGRLSKEMPVQLSNVMLLCPKCNKPTRTGVKIAADGLKTRVCKKCKADIGTISKPKKKDKPKAAAK
jgi:large subunit ribosomal protein L24